VKATFYVEDRDSSAHLTDLELPEIPRMDETIWIDGHGTYKVWKIFWRLDSTGVRYVVITLKTLEELRQCWWNGNAMDWGIR
jgi:hypothetical protein